MRKHKHKLEQLWLLIPLFGILFFVLLYYLATKYYPGGSQLNNQTKEFSWAQNYWCNLLNENAMNGMHNPARPIAIFAMIVLAFTLIIFWFLFTQQILFGRRMKIFIRSSAVISMFFCMLLFTSLHDMAINLATLFGLIPITGTFIGLKKLKWIKLFWMGLFIILFILLNNFLYYKQGMLYYLPIVQKITFLYFLTWICLIDINLFKNFISKEKFISK